MQDLMLTPHVRRAALTLLRRETGWILDIADIRQVTRLGNGYDRVATSSGLVHAVETAHMRDILDCRQCETGDIAGTEWNDDGTVLSCIACGLDVT